MAASSEPALTYVEWFDSGSSGGSSWATRVQHKQNVKVHVVRSMGHVMDEDGETLWLAMGYVPGLAPDETIWYNIAAIHKDNIFIRRELKV